MTLLKLVKTRSEHVFGYQSMATRIPRMVYLCAHPIASRLPSPKPDADQTKFSAGAAPTKVTQATEWISASRSDVVFKKSFPAVGWEAKRRIDPPQRTTRSVHGIHELRRPRIVHPVSVHTTNCQNVLQVPHLLACWHCGRQWAWLAD